MEEKGKSLEDALQEGLKNTKEKEKKALHVGDLLVRRPGLGSIRESVGEDEFVMAVRDEMKRDDWKWLSI